MALDDILETIRAESEATASRIVATARAEAGRLLERAREEAKREEQRRATTRDDRAEAERRRIISRAQLQAAHGRRAVREQIYREALEGVKRRLVELRSSPRYENVLATLLDEAIAFLPEATTVRVDFEDSAAMKRALSARNLDLDLETAELPLGGVVVYALGRTVDNSLRSRLERADGHLRRMAADLVPELGGEPG